MCAIIFVSVTSQADSFAGVWNHHRQAAAVDAIRLIKHDTGREHLAETATEETLLSQDRIHRKVLLFKDESITMIAAN